MLLEVEQDLLKELSIFYDKIKFNFQLEYALFLSEDKKNNLFHINFDKQFFFISEVVDPFFSYNAEKDIYELSVLGAKKKFNNFLQKKVYYSSMNHQALSKYSSMKDNIFSVQEIGTIIDYNKITLYDFIKGEFLRTLFLRIIDLRIPGNIYYQDDYGEYQKSKGTYFTQEIVEYLTREFATKYHICYIPNIKYQKMLSTIDLIASNEQFKYEVINGNLKSFLNKFHNFMLSNEINRIEVEFFEEEFKIKKGTLESIELEILSEKDSITLKKELSVLLKETIQDEKLTNEERKKILEKILFKKGSFGFVNLLQLILLVAIIFIICYGIFLYLMISR